MLVAERKIKLRGPQNRVVSVRLYRPQVTESDWTCEYEIGWPEATRRSSAAGVDAMQALYLAMQKIGIDLYMSEYHRSRELVWSEVDEGYGFPLPKNARQFLVGMDKEFEG